MSLSGAGPDTTLSLNYYTPIAFLPEDGAKLYAIQTYFAIGCLGALIWDIIIHLPQDFKLATQHRINFPFIVYGISRLSCLAYLVSFVVVSTAPIGDCSMVRKLAFIYAVAVPSTLLLFVFRVIALYHHRKYAVVFFSCLWIGLLACSIVMPFGISAYKVPFTNYCVETKTGFAYNVIDLSPFIHDTIIFIATSWAFIYNSSAYQDMTLKNGLRVLVFGNFLPAFSKTILRDGQLYYLTILLLNIVVIIAYHTHNPWLSNCTFGFPLFVLMNTLAGQIYRNIRFHVYDHTIPSSAINKNLTRAGMKAPGAGSPGYPSWSNSVLDISKRSVTTVETGTRQHLIEENKSIHGEGSEKRWDGV